MKIIDSSEFRDEQGEISFQNRIKGTLQFGSNWYGEMQSQAEASSRLEKSLGREHTLLCNVIIPETTLSVPMILLSPQGVRVVMPSPIKGVYRAKGEEWLKFGGRSRHFVKSRPNLQSQALSMAQGVHKFLRDQGYPLPEVEAVLILTNPRTHVDTARPKVRLVQADAIDHFAANLQEFQPIMDQSDISTLVDVLTGVKKAEAEGAPEPMDISEVEAELPESILEPEDDGGDGPIVEPVALQPRTLRPIPGKRPRLSRRQWILLGVMGFFQLIILIILAVLVLADTLY